MSSSGKRAPRIDATKNREQLVAAARRVFAESGPDAPLEDVAQAASVSRTTLYRNFRTREQLIATLLEENVTEIEKHAAALHGSSRGIVLLFDFVLDQQSVNGALVRVLVRADEAPLLALSRRTREAFGPLLVTGLRDGTIHADVQMDDVMLAFSMAAEAIAESARTGRRMDDRVRVLLHRALWRAER
ncbi:TetR family transcriptional regulator (plasmid) [Rathayibacter sp. VKM Ac-2803]|uniref:HTH tetR-type domain-containing protein n=1 Tax=Rathayibacter caricis DSM 15933 TaxID=1328867 RepID=A0A2T4UNS0_9MICO|nr:MULTISPECIES: TetR/AcrR family transcriptional regulator [Rathayibacter]MWV51574.1 TetR family transcriptional regulator [Rathayibacter sp. VKM Ac-2803]PTL71175.1 hypothetical protein C1I63_18165 [Rathayibacter caricis DSM 15933]